VDPGHQRHDPARLGCPQPFILAFSWVALLAAILSAVGLATLVPVWRAKRQGGMEPLAQAAVHLTALIFAGLALLMALRGALEPWSA
jgi:hypothetical protein